MTTEVPDRSLIITRDLDAPRELVWRAWTEPEHFMRWWGPFDFTAPVCRIDLRVGGRYLAAMRDSSGRDYYSTGEYREIAPPERLVYTDSFADADGNIVPGSHYGIDDFPLETMVTVVLEDLGGGRTRMTMTHAGIPAGRTADDTATGWAQSFEKLAASLR